MGTYNIEEKTFTSFDNTELFYRVWLPEQPNGKAVMIFHRGHEHSGRLLRFAEELELDGFTLFAWDARGNGKSPGPRDDAESFSVYAKDADCFFRYITAEYNISEQNIAVIANSVGGVIASAWIHDYAPRIRSLVLAAPAFRIKLYVPLAVPLLRVARKIGLMKYVRSYVKSRVLTHDREEQEKFNNDPMISNSISTNILLDVYDTSTRLIKDAGAIRVPTLMLAAGSDWVVKTGAQKMFFKQLSSPVKEWELYKGFYHAIYHEKERKIAIDRTREFILRQFEENTGLAPLLDADKEGYTKSEYDRLKKRSFNPFFCIAKSTLATAGRLSKGIRIGWKDGFDSGVMLDHVYENCASGFSPFGKMIDRIYLNSPGWSGIRQRKINIERILRETASKVKSYGKPVHIVDIAAGPGRYILETISRINNDTTALLRDYKDVNIEQGRELASSMGLENVRFEKGDAFDRTSLSSLDPSPTIAVVSGLYELFPENKSIRESLKGLAEAMEPGSYLIYTNQPWHPQLEFISRVLRNREGTDWTMRCRTQEEMDDLVREAGFSKTEMEIDKWGIFTVSVARKS